MLLRGKIGPENRVNIFLSYKSDIKNQDNSFGIYVINYGFIYFHLADSLNGKESKDNQDFI